MTDPGRTSQFHTFMNPEKITINLVPCARKCKDFCFPADNVAARWDREYFIRDGKHHLYEVSAWG